VRDRRAREYLIHLEGAVRKCHRVAFRPQLATSHADDAMCNESGGITGLGERARRIEQHDVAERRAKIAPKP
jgi:hypothetical protein